MKKKHLNKIFESKIIALKKKLEEIIQIKNQELSTKKNRNKSKFTKNRLIIIKMYKNILFIKEKVKIKICQKKIKLLY